MDPKPKTKRHSNPPSRQRRNAIRAFLYRWQRDNKPETRDAETQTVYVPETRDIAIQTVADKATQTDSGDNNLENITPNTKKTKDLDYSNGPLVPFVKRETINLNKYPDNQTKTVHAVSNLGDPTSVHEDFEHMLQCSRLEEIGNLTTALRFVTRLKHARGSSVTFPIPEAVDRLQLKSVNLPTDPDRLQQLILSAFERRGETVSFEDIYRDFVKAHGRTTIDPKEIFPRCIVHTHHP